MFLFKGCQKFISILLTHARGLYDDIRCKLIAVHKSLVYISQELIGWEESHVIPCLSLNHVIQVICIGLIHPRGALCVAGCNISTNKDRGLLWLKNRIRVYSVRILFCTKQILVIANWQEGCGEENRAYSSIQTFLQLSRWIHAKEINSKLAIICIVAENLISLV